jgi:hypothetical protein
MEKIPEKGMGKWLAKSGRLGVINTRSGGWTFPHGVPHPYLLGVGRLDANLFAPDPTKRTLGENHQPF